MKILVCGDFVPQKRVGKQIENGDFSCFDEVKKITASSDYSIINFESPIVDGDASPIIKIGPNLKCHKNAMRAVCYAGFNCVTLANNHFYDYGDKGVSDTLHACLTNGIDHVGGGENLKEAENVLYKDIKGERLAIINVCEHEWSIATANRGGSAPLNLIRNIKSIRKAKSEANYVVVIVHGGTENYQLPTPRMKETYRFFVDEGADAVINHHQHCYSGYEVYHEKPIFYGLGNFCFEENDSSDMLWNTGFAVQLEISNIAIRFKMLPYEQCINEPQINFLEDTSRFDERIKELNSIINNDDELKASFQKMAHTHRFFLMMLEPYNNKYLRFLFSKGFLPSFVKTDKKNIILELFKCEAHRDIMFELLTK